MMRPCPDPKHFETRPILGILATTDLALDCINGALREAFPVIADGRPDPYYSCEILRDAYTAMTLAQALQDAISEIYTTIRADIEPDDDEIF